MKPLLYIILLASFFGFCNARADDDHIRAKDLVASGEILPLEKILQNAFAGRHWRLLEAELDQEHGHYIYELEILDEKGKVWKLEYDAKSGQAIKSREK
jgi:uncharacterized membrane protein YkoI